MSVGSFGLNPVGQEPGKLMSRATSKGSQASFGDKGEMPDEDDEEETVKEMKSECQDDND